MWKKLGSIWVTGLVMEGIWVSTYWIGAFREHTGPFLALMIAGFALCIWSFFRLTLQNNKTAALVVGFGLLFRLTVLPAPPWQSEDVYRYIWDARVAGAGINPFRYSPDAPELESLRDTRVYPMINSKRYITAYPPVSQLLFLACYRVFGENVIAMKAVFSLLEFGSILLAWRLLTLFGISLRNLFLVTWNPFFVFEFSHSGHSDSGMIFLLLLAVCLLRCSRKSWGMVSYAGAILSKLHPALLLPSYFRRAGWRASLTGTGAAAALVLAYFNISSGLMYLSSLGLYYRLFEFNAGIHYFLRFIGRVFYHEAWDKITGPYLGVALVLIAVAMFWRFPVRDELGLIHAGFWLMTADLCLATTVHPWYLSWAALALPFFPYAFMLYWTGAAFLSYLAYSYNPVYEPAWVLLVEYLPMYGLMGWEIYRRGPLLREKAA